MRVATHNNSEALKHLVELREVIADSLLFGGESALDGETRFFFSNIKDRLKADVAYLLNNMRRGEMPVYGFEPFDDAVDLWAN
jgi:hypothetical protein